VQLLSFALCGLLIAFAWKSKSHLATDVTVGIIIVAHIQVVHPFIVFFIYSLLHIFIIYHLCHLSSLNISLFIKENADIQLIYFIISSQFQKRYFQMRLHSKD